MVEAAPAGSVMGPGGGGRSSASVPPGLLWAATACLVAPLLLSVSADADLWWHILTGQAILESRTVPTQDTWSYTCAGCAWVNHEWLAEVSQAAVWEAAGNPGLLVWRAVWLLGAVLALMAALWARWQEPVGVLLLLGLPLPAYATMINLRPHSITFALVPLTVVLVGLIPKHPRAAIATLVAVMLVWANCHAGFLLGLLICAAGIVHAWLRYAPRHEDLPRWTFALGLAGLLIAPFATPFGVDLLRYVYAELSAPHPELVEWNPPEGVMKSILLACVGIPAGLTLLARRRPSAIDWIFLAIVTAGAARNAKFTVFALMFGSLCAATPLRQVCDRAVGPVRGLLLYSRRPLSIAIVTVAIAAGGRPSFGGAGAVHVDPALYPVGAVAFLKASAGEGRLWCPLGWGGYVLFHLQHRYRVAIDGRNTTVYPVGFVVEQTEAIYSGDVQQALATSPDILVIPSGTPLASGLSETRGYAEVYADGTARVYAREGSGFRRAGRFELPGLEFP